MTEVEFWFWMIRDAASGERCRSVGRLTESEARRRDPEALRVEGSCERRVLPRHPDAWLPRQLPRASAAVARPGSTRQHAQPGQKQQSPSLRPGPGA